jgi:hypothetical protein
MIDLDINADESDKKLSVESNEIAKTPLRRRGCCKCSPSVRESAKMLVCSSCFLNAALQRLVIETD